MGTKYLYYMAEQECYSETVSSALRALLEISKISLQPGGSSHRQKHCLCNKELLQIIHD